MGIDKLRLNAVNEIKKIAQDFFIEKDAKEVNNSKLPLMSRLYDENELAEVVDTLLTPEKVTMNASGNLKTEAFENLWADYVGVNNGIMVNSGSSANLVAFYALTNPMVNNRLSPGDEVIIPSLNWSTSVTPLYALGLKPVFVDCKLDDYSMDVDQLDKALSSKTKAIMVVHLLGFPTDMDKIMAFANKHDLFVVEDTCESHGAEWKGKKVGSFGHLSTFSFYLSHHITTIEGGMVMTNDNSLAELSRIIRSQGVMRNVKSQKYKDNINSKYPNIDPRFLFANTGYNFRPTEMEGAFGVVQFKRFNKYLQSRIDLAKYYTDNLSKFSKFFDLPEVKEGTKASWFSYPIMVRDDAPFKAKDIVNFLESKNIETRPIMSGDFTQHPVADLFEHRIIGNIENTKKVHKNAFFIGVHAGINANQRNYAISCFEEYLSKYI